ncbi:hypothetical protein DACRYDRAFT_25317 [Dacryopinax primogenitus]|uniref:Uncharacterized protein n=1 Tax=Dacryopinax primogenitus (strain DJM 731) TaxID=1858805 RepID=M5FQZ1_DACPD|nr:uncharacterized protein DACRYDRAFT_25317 [Dacryopinax primogenitus]EJT97219.1 hypothetical protein DACRYDRAFT_25317 [Dacryopinax primogenitus]
MLSLCSLIIALVTASVSVALPHEARTVELSERQGPSGYVVYPPGGTSFDIIGGGGPNGGVTYLNIQYQGVNLQDPYVQTVGIDIYLHDPTGQQADSYLTYEFASDPSGTLIEGYFVPALCGDFELVFIEHQNMGNFGDIIKFKAAAPSITIVCSPEQR